MIEMKKTVPDVNDDHASFSPAKTYLKEKHMFIKIT